jgi:hypothetical protein
LLFERIELIQADPFYFIALVVELLEELFCVRAFEKNG